MAGDRLRGHAGSSSGKWGLNVVRQASVPIDFDQEEFDEGFRADLIVEEKVIHGLKSVETISPAHGSSF